MTFHPFVATGSAGGGGAGIGTAVAAPTGNAAADSANIRTALSNAGTAGGGYVILQNGNYVGDTGTFDIPASVTLYFQQATVLTINCTGGATVDAITIENGGAIVGQGFGGTQVAAGGQIVGSATVNCRSLISNGNHALQEFVYVNGVKIDLIGGGTYGTAVLYFVACFVNSGVRDVVISCNGNNTGVPGILITGTASQGYGPFYIENTWVNNSGGDGINITENNPAGGTAQVWLYNVTVEGPADGFHNIHIQGISSLYNVKIHGLHTENGNVTTTGPVAGVFVNGGANVTITDWVCTTQHIANKYCLWINGGVMGAFRVKLLNLENVNLINPAIQDDTGSGLSIGGSNNVYEYSGPGTTGIHLGTLNLGGASGTATQGDLILGTQSVALASSSVNARNGNVVIVAALAAGVTVAAPTNPINGQLLIYRFVQNGTGGNAVAWNAVFKVAAGVVSTTANLNSTVGFRYDGTNWVQIFFTTGV